MASWVKSMLIHSINEVSQLYQYLLERKCWEDGPKSLWASWSCFRRSSTETCIRHPRIIWFQNNNFNNILDLNIMVNDDTSQDCLYRLLFYLWNRNMGMKTDSFQHQVTANSARHSSKQFLWISSLNPLNNHSGLALSWWSPFYRGRRWER